MALRAYLIGARYSTNDCFTSLKKVKLYARAKYISKEHRQRPQSVQWPWAFACALRDAAIGARSS